jgi:tetratricopeptide (TPR) repeat protein
LDSEHNNLRQMLDRTLDHGQVETIMRVAHEFSSYWQSRGHLHEARRWLSAALAAEGDVPVTVRAAGLTQLGMIARELGDLDESQQLLSDALTLFRSSGDEVGSLHTVSNLAWIAMYRGEYETSHSLQEEILRIARASGDAHLLAETLTDVAIGLAAIGEYRLADALAEESVDRARRLKDRRVEARGVLYLGCFALWQGNVDRAAELAERSLAITSDLDDSRLVFALELLGFIALERGDAKRAATLFSESLRRNQHARSLMRFAVSFEGLAGALASSGSPEQGARFIGVATAVRDAVGAKVFPGRRAGYERTIQRLRASLPGDVYDAEVTAGRDMSLDDALSLALEPDANSLPISIRA